MQKPAAMGEGDQNLAPEWLNIDLTPLYRQLEHAEAGGAAAIVEDYLRPMLEMVGTSLLMSEYVMMDIRMGAARLLARCGIEPSRVMPELLHWEELPDTWRDPQALAAYAGQLFSRCLECRDRCAAVSANAAVRAACAYMEAGFHRKELTLQDAARYVGLSNNHFCTLFRREMGVSFVSYLTELRMERAKRYLLETDLSSADIAERVGYTDPCYFRTLFKRCTGMNPRNYRLNNR